METFDLTEHPHTRQNLLNGEWILVSPHRTRRPWQGKTEAIAPDIRPAFDPGCYLCPGNKRAGDITNPKYTEPYAFTNDFSALLPDVPLGSAETGGMLRVKSARGICRVVVFSPYHNQTLPEMPEDEIRKVVDLWCREMEHLKGHDWIRYIQIFENKGDIMGCSNPHPHGQIWAQSDLPLEIVKENSQQAQYFVEHGRSLLSDYLELELSGRDRIVLENEHFVALVPFWAVWPFETMIISRRHVQYLTDFSDQEKDALAGILKALTTVYDNLFQTSFPYSAGIHQAPVNEGHYPGWHWHMHFYPPLLRSATVKKFMVGYEMLANPQRDITAEKAAEMLRALSREHYLSGRQ